MKTVVVVGNPKPRSRTYDASVTLAGRIASEPPEVVFDLVDLGAGLLTSGDLNVEAAIKELQTASIAIFASPTYKATYSGLLKLFLDQIPADGLRGVIAVPLMLGAAPHHALAPELLLKPVLVELGATCPTRGLYLLESAYTEEAASASWLAAARPQLLAAARPVQE